MAITEDTRIGTRSIDGAAFIPEEFTVQPMWDEISTSEPELFD